MRMPEVISSAVAILLLSYARRFEAIRYISAQPALPGVVPVCHWLHDPTRLLDYPACMYVIVLLQSHRVSSTDLAGSHTYHLTTDCCLSPSSMKAVPASTVLLSASCYLAGGARGMCLIAQTLHLTGRVPGELGSSEAGVHVLADKRQSCDKMERAHHMKLLPSASSPRTALQTACI